MYIICVHKSFESCYTCIVVQSIAHVLYRYSKAFQHVRGGWWCILYYNHSEWGDWNR